MIIDRIYGKIDRKIDRKKALNLKKIRILKTIKSLGRMWERSRQIERQLG